MGMGFSHLEKKTVHVFRVHRFGYPEVHRPFLRAAGGEYIPKLPNPSAETMGRGGDRCPAPGGIADPSEPGLVLEKDQGRSFRMSPERFPEPVRKFF